MLTGVIGEDYSSFNGGIVTILGLQQLQCGQILERESLLTLDGADSRERTRSFLEREYEISDFLSPQLFKA